MTNVLTVRIPVDLLGRAEARAHRLGLDRAKYVRQLIEKDIEEAAGEEESRRRFASEDLAGSFRLCGRPAINTRVRKQLARRLSAASFCLPGHVTGAGPGGTAWAVRISGGQSAGEPD